MLEGVSWRKRAISLSVVDKPRGEPNCDNLVVALEFSK